VFSRFAAQLDDETRRTLERGRRVREVLKQDETELLDAADQIAVLLAATEGVFDLIDVESVADAQTAVRTRIREWHPELRQRIDDGEELTTDDRLVLTETATEAIAPWIPPES
jgi:F-type H+-transporting ATPase subunit alpha